MIRDDVRQFILENFMFGSSPQDLDDSASFLETGIVDSTGIMELIGFLESEFQTKIEDREMIPENLDSIDRVVKYLEGKGVASQP